MTDRNIEKIDVGELCSNECINLCSNDSNTDSSYDDDNDDDTTNLCTNLHESSHPIFVETDDTSVSINHDTVCGTDDTKLVKAVDIEFNCDFNKIKKEAIEICNLLPKFKYDIVYNTLCANYDAQNRIELSLCNLLSNKIPTEKCLQDFSVQNKHLQQNNKQINNDMEIVLNNTSNSQTVCKNKNGVLRTNCRNGLHEVLAESAEISSTAGRRLHPAKLTIDQKSPHTECVSSVNSFILSPSNVVANTDKHLKTRTTTHSSAYVQRYRNNKFSQKHVSSTRNVSMLNSTNNNINQIFDQYMQYLKYMEYVKQQKLIGTFKYFNFNQRNDVRKRFLESCASNLEDIDRRNKIDKKQSCKRNKHAVTKNIASISKSQQVHERLVFIFPRIDKNTIIQICANLTKSGIICSTDQLHTIAKGILVTITDFAGLFLSIKANTAVETITNSNSLLPHPVNFNYSLSRTKNTLTNATSTAAFSISETQQMFGGARKKKIEYNCSESNKEGETNIVLPLKFKEMYEILITTYSQVDKNFIKQTCKNVSKLEDMCSMEQLEILAVQTIQKKMQSADGTIMSLCHQDDENEQYMYLLGIFPNADPAYLRKIIGRTKDNPTEITNFILTQWDNPTYPTKQDKFEKIKISEQQMQLIKKFDVKQFLKTFPDPVNYFTNARRVCKFNSEALTFLKSHFSHFQVSTLTNVYTLYRYNVTLTVRQLENMPPYKKMAKNVYSWQKSPPEDVPLLQECTFIIHEKEIGEYLNKLKEAEMKEFKALKEKNELLECQCCYDSECMPSKCSTCDDGHIFCNACILKGTESQLASGNTRISCFSDCDGEFTVPTLQKILPPTQFSIFIRKKQEIEVMAAGVEGLVSCPFCHFASIPPSEDKVFKCLNPECMKDSCRLCKELNHVPFRCYEERSEKARLILEEKMTEALVRKCYNCSKPYFKADGCNKINCGCGAVMCYICDAPIKDYSHFSTSGCPTYSDNDSINAGTVRAVAVETVKLLKQKDPYADIKVDDLLKNLPSRSLDAITKRVNKIARFKE